MMTLFHRPLLEDISCVADLRHVRLLLHSLLVRKTNSLTMMTMMVRRIIIPIVTTVLTKALIMVLTFAFIMVIMFLRIAVLSGLFCVAASFLIFFFSSVC